MNGSIGYVRHIIYHNGRPPLIPNAVLVEFENYNGPTLVGTNLVPITKTSFVVEEISRKTMTNIPLVPCYGMTIHKSQGMTLDKVVIHLGESEMCLGLTYVALSRVRRLEDLKISYFSYDRLVSLQEHRKLRERLLEIQRLQNLNILQRR